MTDRIVSACCESTCSFRLDIASLSRRFSSSNRAMRALDGLYRKSEYILYCLGIQASHRGIFACSMYVHSFPRAWQCWHFGRPLLHFSFGITLVSHFITTNIDAAQTNLLLTTIFTGNRGSPFLFPWCRGWIPKHGRCRFQDRFYGRVSKQSGRSRISLLILSAAFIPFWVSPGIWLPVTLPMIWKH